MKRSRSSPGGSTSRRKSKSSSRSSGPKKSFSKSSGSRAGRTGKKPFSSDRKESGMPERKSYGKRAGERPKRDGDKPERKPFNRSYSKPEGRNFKSPGRDGDRPNRFQASGDKPERKPFNRTSDKPEGRDFKSPRGTGDRPDRFKRSFNKPERGSFSGSSDKSSGGGSYLRRREDRPKREDGDSEERNSVRPENDRGLSPEKTERTPFREKRSEVRTGTSDDRKKRKRIGDNDKPFFKKEERSSERKYKSDRSGTKSDSPRAYGEKKYGDKPGREKRETSFTRSPAGDRPEKPWNRKEKHEFFGDRKKRSASPVIKTADDGSTRLNKFIANAGICSRREADELIEAGVVSVNGKIITEMGYKVMPGDDVKYNNELLRGERLVYILLNKPKDFITTTDDPEDRKTVMNLIAKACKERVYPVGRLDRNTTGVLIFTNDGDLAKKLTHPSFQVHKIYQVELDRQLKTSDMELISAGINLDDGYIKPDEIVYAGKEKNIIGMELHSGKNRIVRRIFEHLGYEVKKLDRVVFAGLTKKDVPRGRWRFLTEMEVANLKMSTGEKRVRVR